ncbi:4-(cytidine 5'-diphospho)-2-C-methyl-D-erythritol kinase [Pseudorhodobacter turbinis]|uniref:4-diphosphocytidyl-2-C-methyl-D-erythritol kinase n=1 Tax=Pseudorhodobacter turbinis TaxID=2500533 RepID=A0A4P8EHL1_9RHOB|nr:4-(cytidine 5'-diphospho)-2-C-methyl-D-erythritol kinase [Pseudorhodobacter turbinis]QCO56262.1 4-(cytidine 5'-diphospho)-2-C-methyl-D-erythritol kinase [Pseudorhodobacter turbinis]
MITETAPAKINLTLHVTGQRSDGYHLLDSLVVFADIGDQITASPASGLSLRVDGPFAAGLEGDDNLVLQAARFLGPQRKARITLTKNLPVASGIGGGSADAAAALRALSRLWDVPLPQDVAALGADVPACVHGKPLRLQGIGDRISPLPTLPALDILLVNPGVSVSTPAIFKALTQKAHPPMPEVLPDWPDAANFAGWLARQRNDLAAPAMQLAPEIDAVLHRLRASNCLFAGMSGSGATCFALFLPDGYSAKAAQAQIAAETPDWWAAAGKVN